MSAQVVTGAWSVTGLPVLHVERRGDRHTVRDLLLDVRLDLTPPAAVDSAALQTSIRQRAAECPGGDIELCALSIARDCLTDSVAAAVVTIRAYIWNHLDIAGRPRASDLIGSGGAERTARASVSAAGEQLAAGLAGLELLAPAAMSAGTVTQLTLDAVWTYGWKEVPFDTQYQQVRRVLTEAYAERDGDEPGSLAEALGEAVLAASPAVRTVEIRLEARERTIADAAGGAGRAGARTVHECMVTREEPVG